MHCLLQSISRETWQPESVIAAVAWQHTSWIQSYCEKAWVGMEGQVNVLVPLIGFGLDNNVQSFVMKYFSLIVLGVPVSYLKDQTKTCLKIHIGCCI